MLKGQLDEVLVRRLKSDIRALEGGFPKRTMVPVDIEGLPSDAPELVLARMLDAYRLERENRLKDETRSKQAAGALVIGGLQKRLLSSIEAFAKTLAVHLLCAQGGEPFESGADASDRRVVHEVPVLRQPPDGPPVAAGRRLRRPSPGSQVDAIDRPGGDLSGAENQRAASHAPDLSLSSQRDVSIPE